MKNLILIIAAATLMACSPAGKFSLTEERYQVLAEPLQEYANQEPTVIEFFWLGCPTCQAFEPAAREWREKWQAQGVKLIKVPAIQSQRWAFDAAVWIVLQDMTNNDKSTLDALFDFYINKTMIANQVRDDDSVAQEDKARRPLPDDKEIAEFVKSQGIDDAEFLRRVGDESLKPRLLHLFNQFKASGSRGVPAFVTNGTHLLVKDGLESFDDYFVALTAMAKNEFPSD